MSDSELFLHNRATQNSVDATNYVQKQSHQWRIEIVLSMIREELASRVQATTQAAPGGGGRKPNLLSVGCATGVIEEQIIDLGVCVYGFDGSEVALAEARRRGVITAHGDITKQLPYDDSVFDFVFGGEVIEHILDVKTFLLELRRVLKPGGVIILTTPNLARFADRLRFLVEKLRIMFRRCMNISIFISVHLPQKH